MATPERVRQHRPGMTQEELEALPVSFDFQTACRAYRIGKNLGYDLVKRGEFPCRVLRFGTSYRVTRADLLRSLGLDPMTAKPAEPAAA